MLVNRLQDIQQCSLISNLRWTYYVYFIACDWMEKNVPWKSSDLRHSCHHLCSLYSEFHIKQLLIYKSSRYWVTSSLIWSNVSGHLANVSLIFSLSFSSVFGPHQLQREISDSLAAKCFTAFTSKSLTAVVWCWAGSLKLFHWKQLPAVAENIIRVRVNQNSKFPDWTAKQWAETPYKVPSSQVELQKSGDNSL